MNVFHYLQRNFESLDKACAVPIVFDLLLTLLLTHNYKAF
jgi:hypothetical protein